MTTSHPLAHLIDDLRRFRPDGHEPTLLGIGGRGYYENPCSDLLEFFLKPENAAVHGLGNLFFDALCHASLISPERTLPTPTHVFREPGTDDGKRIDLLLHGKGWTMAVENKIRHHQANPFEDYERRAREAGAKGDELHYIILSPGGEGNACHKKWKGLSYRTFLNELSARLQEIPEDRRNRKWWYFACDFVSHLNQELYSQPMNEQDARFISDNYSDLKKAAKLVQAFDEMRGLEMLERLKKRFATDQVEHSHSWAHHYRSPLWPDSYSVWWIDETTVEASINLRVYLNYGSEERVARAKEAFAGLPEFRHAPEGRNCHHWTAEKLADTDETRTLFVKGTEILRSLYGEVAP